MRRLARATSDLAVRAELDSIAVESDAALAAEGLFSLAQRQEESGRVDFAAEIYTTLSGPGFTEAARRRATERLGVLQGHGPFGARFELLARHFARQASDPAMLGAMALGGAVFQTTRLAVLSRLAASPTASFLTRGLGARALSWGAGFALEFPTFTFAARGLHEAMGVSQDWSRQAVGRDLLSSGLTLFLLKGSGAAGTSLVRRVEGSAAGTTAFARFSAAAIPQLSAYTGILGSHLLEARLGLRPHTDASSAMFESLATLLQFHVGGRILGHVTGNAYERNLDLLGRHLEGSRLLFPPASGPGAEPLANPSLVPVLAGESGDPLLPPILMMSNLRPSPSDRPRPLSDRPRPRSDRPGPLTEENEGGSGAKVVPHPSHLRDLKTDLDQLDKVLYRIYRGETEALTWREEAKKISGELQLITHELHHRVGQESGRSGILPYLQDLALEYQTIENLLGRSLVSQRSLAPTAVLDLHQFFTYIIRSTNNLINFIDHSVPIQAPIENARRARSWLQRGLEGEESTTDEIAPPHPHFPYSRLTDGSFAVKAPNLNILVLGDENAPRTFQLAEQGHRVSHLGADDTTVRTTERRLRYRTETKRKSGEWAFDFNPDVSFHVDSAEVPPADLIESYFPPQLSELAPRSSTERLDTLQHYLEQVLTQRLALGGSAFVISERDEAVEDLANLVLRNPRLELLEVRHRRTHLPLVGGTAATIEPGEAMASWLVFRLAH